MNEMIFFSQIFVIFTFALGAWRLGQGALTAWVAIQALIANLFVLKQITLFGFEVTASDVFVIGSLLGLNILQEYFGKEEAKKATWICFFFMVFFAVISQMHLLYQPNAYDMTNPSYQTILSPAPRLLIASMGVFFIVQQFDIRFFAFLKNQFPQIGFASRVAIALVVSQFLDTCLFAYIGLYGLVVSVVDIIAVSFAIKLIVIFSISPLLKRASKWRQA